MTATSTADEFTELRRDLRGLIDRICADFPDAYWRERRPPAAVPRGVRRRADRRGCLGALVPEEYGGVGLGIADASVMLEEINRNGGNAGAVHAQMYTMGTVLRHGSDEQKRRYLPGIATGELRLQAFGVTEPTRGSDTTASAPPPRATDDGYVVNGQKVFISRVQHSDLMLLLARTTPLDEVERRSPTGCRVFLVDLRDAGDGARAPSARGRW